MSEENKNYDEYDATPLTMEEAIVEAKRCLNCKKAGLYNRLSYKQRHT